MMKISGFVLIGSLLLAGSAAAQTADGGGTSSQDKKHVEALFQAQDSSGPTLTKEQIAAYRDESGWGKAFKQMQADGYYAGYKNFGQVISESKTGEISHANKGATVKASKANKAKRSKTAKPRRVSRVNRPNRPNRSNRPNRPKRPHRR